MYNKFTNVNLNDLLKQPELLPDLCYQLRKEISPPNELIPKSFFANMLNCEIIELSQIESGHIYNVTLAFRYYLKLLQVYKLFNT